MTEYNEPTAKQIQFARVVVDSIKATPTDSAVNAGAPGDSDAERAAWLGDKIAALGDYAREASAMLQRWPAPPVTVPRFDAAELIVRDVCEMDRADPDLNDTLCVDVSDLLVIAKRHTEAAPKADSRACEHKWAAFYTGSNQTHWVCAKCAEKQPAPYALPPSPASAQVGEVATVHECGPLNSYSYHLVKCFADAPIAVGTKLYTAKPQADAGVSGLPVSQESKYTVNGSHIINRASGEAIPHDEPVFIFRARDKYAAGVIGDYCAQFCNDPAHAAAVEARFIQFSEWAEAHPERMKEPDTHGISPAPKEGEL